MALSSTDDEKIVETGNEVQFKQVLDLNVFVLMREDLCLYFARAQVASRLPNLVTKPYFVFVIIDILLPSLCVDVSSIWGKNSTFYIFMKIISFIWQGPFTKSNQTREVTSLFAALAFWSYFVFLIIRSHIYIRKKTINRKYVTVFLAISKYILPLLCPLLTCGVPHAIYNLYYGAAHPVLASATLAVVPITLAVYLYLLFTYILVSVIFEDNLFHEWHQTFGLMSIIGMVSANFAGISAGIFPNTFKMVALLVDLLIKLIAGAIVYILFALPTHKGCVAMTSVGIAGALLDLVQIVNIYKSFLSPEITLILCVIFYVASFVSFWFLSLKSSAKVLRFYDFCEENPLECYAMLSDRYTSETRLLTELRQAFEYCHPFCLSFKPYDFGIEKFPQCAKLLTLYARVLAFFPNQTSKMMEIARLIRKAKRLKAKTNYYAQLNFIACDRESYLTPEINSEITIIQADIVRIHALEKSFWEGVLQRNDSTFWESATHICAEVKRVESGILELRQVYPNQKDVANLHIKFVREVAHNIKKGMQIEEEFRGRIISKMDHATEAAVSTFPLLNSIIFKSESGNGEEDSEDENELDSHNTNVVQTAMHELISGSKLGNALIGIVTVLLMTVGLSIFAYFVNSSYDSKIIDYAESQISLIYEWGRLIYKTSKLMFEANMLPILVNGSLGNTATFMSNVAPTLWASGSIKSIEEPNLSVDASDVEDTMESLTSLIVSAEEENSELSSVYQMIYSDQSYDGMTLQSLILSIAMKARDLSKMSSSNQMVGAYNEMMPLFITGIRNISTNLSGCLDGNFSDKDTAFSTMMILAVLFDLLFIALPFMLQLFKLLIQRDAIIHSFTHIPNSEIRAVAKSLGSTANIDEDSSAIAELQSKEASADTIYVVLSVTFCFLPFMIFCIFLYYEEMSFINSYEDYSKQVYYLYIPSTQFIFGGYYLAQAFQSDAGLVSSQNRSSSLSNSLLRFNYGFKLLTQYTYNGYSTVLTLGDSDFDTFSDQINTSEISNLSLFERVVTSNNYGTTDILSNSISNSIESYENSTISPSDSIFDTIIYYFYTFFPTYRDAVSFGYALSSISYPSFSYLFGIIIAWQVFSAIFSILFLLRSQASIKQVLAFYQALPLNVILQSNEVVSLIETGKSAKSQQNISFAHSDYIISHMTEGMLILDRSLTVKACNRAFIDISIGDADTQESDILDRPFSSLFRESESLTHFRKDLELALEGKLNLSSSSTISTSSLNGKERSMCITVLFMSDSGDFVEENFQEIGTIILIIQDNTESIIRQKKIADEHAVVMNMLIKVLPQSIIKQLQNGNGATAFVSQSATIGHIRVGSDKQWDYTTKEPFEFYDKVYSEFDRILNGYSELSRVRTFSHTYIFAGGLFAQVNKPREHSEQAVMFALNLLKAAKDASEKIGIKVDLTIGIHTGGPVVAGVMGINRPCFQVIGPAMVMSEQMKITGVPGKIQISRAVYELVFSDGFRIEERGEIKTKDGEKVVTYLVSDQS